MATETDLLRDIREAVKADRDAWADVQREGDKDMLCVAGQIWEALDPEALRLRKDRHRPALTLDELGQYTNQLINEIRANKRAVKVSPIGYGATDKTAEYRANRIRQIEYRSNAQAAYTTMFENAVQRSYGYLRITAEYQNPDPNPAALSPADFDQELWIKPIVNPNTVIPDSASVAPDGSDMRHCTIAETMRRAEFEAKFPGASPINFSDAPTLVPDWIKGNSVTVGEHWRIDTTPKTLLLVDFGGQLVPLFQADYARLKAAGQVGEVKREREVQSPRVRQFLTNGLEILDTVDWPGRHIPIVQCLGKVLYLNDGGQTKRVILSLPRLARDPAMLYCYIRTCEAEAIGGVPRATMIGYAGQFQGYENDWQRANHEPVAYLEAKPTTEPTGMQILPLPQRQSWDPPLQNLEIAAEAARRAIQAAIGSMPLPTQAQRQNEKSGVALQRISDTTQRGQLHFVDHYEDSITRVGVILEDLITYYDDTAKDVTVRTPDDATSIVRINDPAHPEAVPVNAGGQAVGQHDVTISTGPQKESERELASDFASSLTQNPTLPQIVGPQKMAKIISLAVKLLNVGPVGDQIADIIDPQPAQAGQPTPDQAQQLLGQAQQVIQVGQQHIQQLEQQIATDAAKQQAQIQMKQMDLDFQKWKVLQDSETKLTVAELGAKVDRLALFLEERARLGVQQHEAGMQQRDQAHDVAMLAADAQRNAEQQAAPAAVEGANASGQ